MKLYERLPDTVTVDGRRYRLNLDFHNVLRMMEVLARDDLIPAARAYIALDCVMRHPPRRRYVGPVLNAVRALLFPAKPRENAERLTSFVQDADLIRAAFWQVYGVNLYVDHLHWFEFSALLAGLPDGCRYMEIIGIRARPMPTPDRHNRKEREALARAKAACKLELSEAERKQAYAAGVQSIFAGLMAWANAGASTSKGGEGSG